VRIPDIDPKWLLRAALAIVVLGFIVVIARVSILAMKPDTARMERAEAAAVGKAPPSPAK
jgi:hypothetical protein